MWVIVQVLRFCKGGAEMVQTRWCSGAEVHAEQVRCAEVQIILRCRGAYVEMQRGRDAEVRMCRYGCAEVQMCRDGVDMEVLLRC
jgi:hypothetical protein